MVSTRNQGRGFGTIEVVIALSLLAVALIGLGGLFMLSLSSGTMAQTSSIATNLARARLEQLRAIPAWEIAGQNGATTIERVPAGEGRPYTVRTAVDTSRPDLIDVTVTVTWHVAYGGACAGDGSGAGCRGSQITLTRMLQTRLKGAGAP